MFIEQFVRRLSGRAIGSLAKTAVLAEVPAGNSARDQVSLSFAELDEAARSVAVWLAEHSATGDRVLLLSPLGPEIVKNILGCLYAGVVPVIAPVPVGCDHHLTQATGIAFDTGATVVLTDTASLPAVHDWISQDGMTDLVCAVTDVVPLGEAADWVDPGHDPDALAILCYGSGKGELVGTMISHAALGHGLRHTSDALGLTAGDRLLTWLPPEEYTGLMNVLTALSVGATVVLMTPEEFRRDPVRWLELVDRHRITVSGAAAAAYARCADAITEREIAGNLDLACWRIAYTSSAKLDPSALARFARAAAPAGFDPAALRVAYCLPEATFLVTTSSPGQALRTVRVSRPALEKNAFVHSQIADEPALVSSGRADALDVRVVDPGSARVLPDRRVGEVWISGDSLAQGYWHREAESSGSFDATLDSGEGGYFRTGDLGVLDDGELFVLGRADDMLTVSGRTLRADDIERDLAEMFPSLRGHPASVFTVAVPRQEIVVVQEFESGFDGPDDLRLLAGSVRSWLRWRTRVRFGSVVFLQAGELPRISCDRTRRALAKDLFIAEAIDPLHEELDADVRRCYRVAVPAGEGVTAGVRVAV
jgi:acyl-CoA synthetase (AMP-forming)/AMP-acid ligase II